MKLIRENKNRMTLTFMIVKNNSRDWDNEEQDLPVIHLKQLNDI